MKTLVIQCPGTVSGSGFRKLENYVGIEFVRGASNGGGDNGYYQMIGDEELLETLPLFNSIHLATVNDAVAASTIQGWTEDDSDGDVMQVFPTMYAILGGTNATYERYIFSDSEFTYDGDTAVEISAWGECPDWEVQVSGSSVARSIMGGTNSYSASSVSSHIYADEDLTTSYSEFTGTGWPLIWNSRYNFERFARAKNDDTTSNIPYCNGTQLDLEVVMGILFVECRTKNINSIFGQGLSSNATPTADTWGKTVSGFRITDSDGEYHYYTLNGTTYIAGTSTNLRNAIGIQYYACTRVLEVQNSIYTGDGNWTLNSVTNSDGDALYDTTGGTGIAVRKYSFYISNWASASGDEEGETVLCELALCVPMWRWRTNLYGNIWSWLSGYEVVNYADEDGTVHNDLYRAPSISAITTDSTSSTSETQTSLEDFPFVSTYEKVDDLGYSSGWCSEALSVDGRVLVTAIKGSNSAGLNNYESAYSLLSSTVSNEGYYTRKGVILGGAVAFSDCSLRYSDAYYAPSISSSYFGSRFRVALD